jgi:hypothetical protein
MSYHSLESCNVTAGAVDAKGTSIEAALIAESDQDLTDVQFPFNNKTYRISRRALNPGMVMYVDTSKRGNGSRWSVLQYLGLDADGNPILQVLSELQGKTYASIVADFLKDNRSFRAVPVI